MLSKEFFNAVMAFNRARYDVVYDPALMLACLVEEAKEFEDAVTLVDKVDALIDFKYFVVGGFYKLAIPYEAARESVISLVAQVGFLGQDYKEAFHNYANLDTANRTVNLPYAYATAYRMLLSLGLSEEAIEKAQMIVAKANATKQVKRVAPHIKANAGSEKGASFVQPEAELEQLLIAEGLV